jgi:hypothetical protein
MSNKTTIALALAAGFIGGTISQHILPTTVHASESVVRAHRFLLVDEKGVDRGAFGFYTDDQGAELPALEVMRRNGHVSTPGGLKVDGHLLPDETCTTCAKPH